MLCHWLFSSHSGGGGLFFSSHDSSDDDDRDASHDYQPSLRVQREMKHKPDTLSLQTGVSRKGLLKATTAAATRFRLSSTAHLAILASTINASGGDMTEMVASLATIKRHRKVALSEKSEEIREEFKKNKPQFLVVHWDGKIVEFLGEQGHTYQDVNAVVLSSPLEMEPRFIGAPVVNRGTGRQLADSTLATLRLWEADEGVIAIVFDTTSSNSGIREGAATHIEEALGYAVLWLACRHHIAELHIKHAYNTIQGPTTGNFSANAWLGMIYNNLSLVTCFGCLML